MKILIRRFAAVSMLAALCAIAGTVQAQGYPARPIRLVVG